MSLSQTKDDKFTPTQAPTLFAGDDWNSTDAPDEGALVEVFAEDWRGRYLVPFAVRFVDDEWRNAATGQELQTFVAGWRPWKGRAAA